MDWLGPVPRKQPINQVRRKSESGREHGRTASVTQANPITLPVQRSTTMHTEYGIPGLPYWAQAVDRCSAHIGPRASLAACVIGWWICWAFTAMAIYSLSQPGHTDCSPVLSNCREVSVARVVPEFDYYGIVARQPRVVSNAIASLWSGFHPPRAFSTWDDLDAPVPPVRALDVAAMLAPQPGMETFPLAPQTFACPAATGKQALYDALHACPVHGPTDAPTRTEWYQVQPRFSDSHPWVAAFAEHALADQGGLHDDDVQWLRAELQRDTAWLRQQARLCTRALRAAQRQHIQALRNRSKSALHIVPDITQTTQAARAYLQRAQDVARRWGHTISRRAQDTAAMLAALEAAGAAELYRVESAVQEGYTEAQAERGQGSPELLNANWAQVKQAVSAGARAAAEAEQSAVQAAGDAWAAMWDSAAQKAHELADTAMQASEDAQLWVAHQCSESACVARKQLEAIIAAQQRTNLISQYWDALAQELGQATQAWNAEPAARKVISAVRGAASSAAHALQTLRDQEQYAIPWDAMFDTVRHGAHH